jgi:protein-disulfide isomerase
MVPRSGRGWRLPCLIAATTALLLAQDWQTATTLNGVEFGGLTPARKSVALKALRNMGCTCGCDMKVAECRVKDPNCAYSKGLAASIVDAVKAGKSEAGALEVAKASKYGHQVEHKLLDDPVQIPTQGAPVTGPANARITLVEFSDFQCPYCGKASQQIAAILKAYPNDVKLIFKQYPLDIHPQALISAQASLAAHAQGKFWQLHDLMFANRSQLSAGAIHFWAQSIGLDMKKFDADVQSPAIKKTVAKDLEDGEKAGVEGTPTVYIDGQRYNGDLELDKIKPVLDGELKKLAARK